MCWAGRTVALPCHCAPVSSGLNLDAHDPFYLISKHFTSANHAWECRRSKLWPLRSYGWLVNGELSNRRGFRMLLGEAIYVRVSDFLDT